MNFFNLSLFGGKRVKRTDISVEEEIAYKEALELNSKLMFEVEKMAHELKLANDRLIKLDEAKNDFISIASHQLRTPLTVIKGYVSMLLSGDFGEMPQSGKEVLDKVSQSNDRLINLVENLLNISRIESGKMILHERSLNLADIIPSIVDSFRKVTDFKGLELVYIKPESSVSAVSADEDKIRQVITNLVDNATKYTKQGKITVELEEVADSSFFAGNCIKFSVSDSGIGISESDLPNLFRKFSRGEGTSLVHTEGVGLGLYICRKIIAAHKGRIWAESLGEGKGAVFSFELPISSK